MGERLSEAERETLRFSAEYGSAYCGYNGSIRRAATRLEALGYGEIFEGNLANISPWDMYTNRSRDMMPGYTLYFIFWI